MCPHVEHGNDVGQMLPMSHMGGSQETGTQGSLSAFQFLNHRATAVPSSGRRTSDQIL